jgi:protein SCO1/2
VTRRTLVVAAAVTLLAGCGGAAPLVGTALDGAPAPDFALTDFRGGAVALSDLRGKAVALTFLFTTCPDVCPLTAETLRTAYELLPADARERVALVAVSVDPARDTPAALAAFSARHGLAGNPAWFALGGTREALQPVWAAYGIDSGAVLGRSHADHAGDVSPAADGYLLAHTDALYLIDPEGRERAFARSDVDPGALAASIAALAG